MKKIILLSAAILAISLPMASASEDVFVNDSVNIESYPLVESVEIDKRKDEESLDRVFDFDYNVDTAYEVFDKSDKKIFLYTETSLVSSDGLEIFYRRGPKARDYEKKKEIYKASKIDGVDVYISKSDSFNGGEDSVFNAEFKFNDIYHSITIRTIGEKDFIKIIDKLINNIKKESPKGDSGYEDGVYLPSLIDISNTKGKQENPYGKSMVGKISQEKKKELISNNKTQILIKAYNETYQTLMQLYKFGAQRMDRWREVDNMIDPVFANINKETFVKVYTNTATILTKVRWYFDSLGLKEEDYTYKESYEMIDRDELKFSPVKIPYV